MEEKDIRINPRAIKALNGIYDRINEICETANLSEEETAAKRQGFMSAALDEFGICVDEAARYAQANMNVDYATALERVITERDKNLCACVEETVKNTGRVFGEVYLEQFIDRAQKYRAIEINPTEQ